MRASASSASGLAPDWYSPICTSISTSRCLAISSRMRAARAEAAGETTWRIRRDRLARTSMAGNWFFAAISRESTRWPSRMLRTSSAIGSEPLSSSSSTV